MAVNYLTPVGLKRLQDELHALLHTERPTVVKAVTAAAENGDRSENADYIYGKKRLREIDRRIRFLQSRLDDIQVIDPKTVQSETVQFGATVTIEDEEGAVSDYQIVGVDEFDVRAGKISWQSPVAKSLMGKRVGDAVTIQRPAGALEVTIVSIQYK